MRCSLSLCLALALLATAAPVRAAEGLALGALEVRSALGQPLDATLTVEAASTAALEGLSVRLATATAYSQRQLARDPSLESLRFALAAPRGGRATVTITSTTPLREPSLTLLIEANTAKAAVQREYTVLLDPPRTGATAKVPIKREVEWGYELDAYYSDVSVEIPLTNTPVPDGGKLSEWEVYRTLFLDSFHPRVLLFEASVYPMPVLGTYVKEHSPDAYNNFTLGNTDVNVLEAVTAGFQEPWAVSAFVGSELNFSREGRSGKGTSKGYMGYLVSYGAKHIKDNVLIDDDWWEFEWKLKGERERQDEHLVWSFRTGIKNHSNHDIADILYFGARRSNLDFKSQYFSWLQNTSFDVVSEFTQDHLEFARMDFVIGKRWPIKGKGYALAIDFGVIYEKNIKYLGVLADPNPDNVTIVIRPNIAF